MLNLALISGSWPPDHCGVGDYSEQLALALRDRGVKVTCLGGAEAAGLRGGLRLSLSARSADFDLVHLQYPGMGFGRSLVPAILPLVIGRRPAVVTMHEFSTFKKIRRPWFATFAHCVSARIFTSDQELKIFSAIMHPTRGRDFVIPIASNIRAARGVARIPNSICNFGMISPGKGIEQFLDLAELCRDEPDLRFNLIGAATETFADYTAAILDRARKLGVTLHLNLPEAEVAGLLASQEYAYLPFSDGASARRGSLMAAQQNGVVVLTTHAEQTPPVMRETTLGVNSPAEALTQLRRLMADPRQLAEFRSCVGRGAGQSWDKIAADHLTLYEAILGEVPVR